MFDLVMGMMVIGDIAGTFLFSKNSSKLAEGLPNIFKFRLLANVLGSGTFNNWKIILNVVFWLRLFSAMSLTDLVGPTMRIMHEMTF